MTTRLLNNTQLRCCTLIEPPMVFEDPNHDYGFNGVAIEYFENLQRKLGFTCNSFELFRDGNKTGFTDFIFNMERCTNNGAIINDPSCRCDIGVTGFAMNPQRFGRVDFLPTFLNDDLRVVTNVQNTGARFGGAFFLTTFSPGVWLAIVSLLVIFIALKLLDNSFAPPPKRRTTSPKDTTWGLRTTYFMLKSRHPFRLRKAVESTLLRIIGQSPQKVEGDYRSFRQRILNFVILLCGLFLVLAYEAIMTASLVQETIESDFRTVRDFQNCRIPPEDVCIPGGGAIEAFWNRAIASSPCIRESGQSPKFVGSVNELLNKTASGECKFAIGTGTTLTEATNGRYCGTLVVTGRPFLEGGCGFALPPGSPLTPIMTNATLQLRSEGALPTLAEYLQRFGECEFLIEPTLTFGRLRLFFFLAYGACFLILVAIIVMPKNPARRIDGVASEGESKVVCNVDDDVV